MVLGNGKIQKNLDSCNVGAGEDKISNLPDVLIHHILSYLPTKGAMSACILSRRWKYLVDSIPILGLMNWRTQWDPYARKKNKLETKQFMNFLDTVLFQEKPNTIQKLYLALDEYFDESRVNRWIKTIMTRRVEELCLSIINLSASIIPLSFFTCDSLAMLDLDFQMAFGSKLNIPETVSFPKLKILHLGSLCFADEASTRNLFSNCPILEVLKLGCCQIYEGLCITNTSLGHLKILDCVYEPSKSTVIKISAPNLRKIKYEGNPPADFVLDSFPSIVAVDVHFYINKEYENPKKILVQLFEKLSKAKLLKVNVCAGSLLALSEVDILLTNLPAFNNLTNLEIGSNLSSAISKFGSNSASIARCYFRFLMLSPNLESIVFSQPIHIPEEECWSLDPKFLLQHLKSMEFKRFTGNQMELNVIKFFLKYARFLETVTVVASRRLSENHEKQISVMKLLLMFPKPADCVVKFLARSEAKVNYSLCEGCGFDLDD